MATRSIGPNRSVVATLDFSGLTMRGLLSGETRIVTGVTVTNNSRVPVGVEIEAEDTKEFFADTISPGETKTVVIKPLVQKWNPDRMSGMWDGLNIRWIVPASRIRTR